MKKLSRGRPRAAAVRLVLVARAATAGGDDESTTAGAVADSPSSSTAAPDPNSVLESSAIPDQDPARLTAFLHGAERFIATDAADDRGIDQTGPKLHLIS